MHVGLDIGHMDRSSTMAKSGTPQLAHNFPTTGYVMPKFKYTHVGNGLIFDAGCKVTFYAHYITVFTPDGRVVLMGWQL